MKGLSRIDRREFLKRTGYASGGLAFALNLGACAPKDGGPLPVAVTGESVAANVYVNIRDDGIVEIVKTIQKKQPQAHCIVMVRQ